jgi:hypothetical protein
MRSTIIIALIVLSALASAQPAAAAPPGDDSAATFTPTKPTGDGVTRSCVAAHKPGVFGQYGAKGYYIAGCTVRLTCPSTRSGCTVMAESRINTERGRGDWVTLNSRTRIFRRGFGVGWRDRSCAGTNWCMTKDTYTVKIRGGDSASVQCNGVRAAGPNRAQVRCTIELGYLRPIDDG